MRDMGYIEVVWFFIPPVSLIEKRHQQNYGLAKRLKHGIIHKRCLEKGYAH
jgi:hypothetical protein